MSAITFQIKRFSVVSARPFGEIMQRLTATIGRPDINAFHALIEATNFADLEKVVRAAIGSTDLVEFIRFDTGRAINKERAGEGPMIMRLVIGNPVIMKEMAKTVPGTAAYAPVTILVDERNDGVHLSYDLMASLLEPYGSEAAQLAAKDLDARIENLLETAAR